MKKKYIEFIVIIIIFIVAILGILSYINQNINHEENNNLNDNKKFKIIRLVFQVI